MANENAATERAAAVPAADVLRAYVKVAKNEGTIDDLAEELGMKKETLSVRLSSMRKDENYSKILRKAKLASKRVSRKVDNSALVEELLAQLDDDDESEEETEE